MRLSDHLVRPLLAMLAPAEPRLRSSGVCAAPAPVLSGATPQQRLLALLGRRA